MNKPFGGHSVDRSSDLEKCSETFHLISNNYFISHFSPAHSFSLYRPSTEIEAGMLRWKDILRTPPPFWISVFHRLLPWVTCTLILVSWQSPHLLILHSLLRIPPLFWALDSYFWCPWMLPWKFFEISSKSSGQIYFAFSWSRFSFWIRFSFNGITAPRSPIQRKTQKCPGFILGFISPLRCWVSPQPGAALWACKLGSHIGSCAQKNPVLRIMLCLCYLKILNHF